MSESKKRKRDSEDSNATDGVKKRETEENATTSTIYEEPIPSTSTEETDECNEIHANGIRGKKVDILYQRQSTSTYECAVTHETHVIGIKTKEIDIKDQRQSTDETQTKSDPKYFIVEEELCDEISIGSTIFSEKSKPCATVGPFLRIKETGELCFLTVRHIFGPFRNTGTFVGKKIFLQNADNEPKICGEIIASEYSESLDVVLVKVFEKSSRVKLIPIPEEDVKETGLHPSHISLYGNVYGSTDIRDKKLADNHRLIKISRTSGLTSGRFILQDGKVATREYQIEIKGPKYSYMEVMTYTNQLCVVPGEFAKMSDVGAATYFVDDNNRLHCIGMICRIKEDTKQVLVTPIQEIITHFEKTLKQTLEIVTFHYNRTGMDERELFTRALINGEEPDSHIRVNIIGYYAQGKTTLTKRLLGESLDDIESTDGIDVHIRKCKMNENTWEKFETDKEFLHMSHRLVDIAKKLKTIPPEGKSDNKDSLDADKSQNVDRKSMEKNNKVSDITYNESDKQSVNVHQSTLKSQQLLRHFTENITENRILPDNELIATIWDFAGQFVYYATHQMFHSRDAIYLLVFDLRKGLDFVLEDFDFPNRQEKMKTSLKFWVNSINAFVGSKDDQRPTIILVGTHKDMFDGDIDTKFNQVKDLFAQTRASKQIYKQAFAVSNVDATDTSIDDLRKTIYSIGAETAASRKIPAIWIPLEMSLLEIRHRNIITFEEFTQIDAQNDFPIKEVNKLKKFLKYHHDKGTLVFYDEEELRNHVVLYPQFLINAFRSIITSKFTYYENKGLYNLWKKLTGMAILENEIIDAVWSQEKNAEFFKFRKILINFLKRHRIIAEILQFDGITGKVAGVGKYMIPSFLKSTCPRATAKDFLHKKIYSKTVLGICLEIDEVLAIVYEKLTAAALGQWQPIKFEDQILVFENVGYYRIGNQHAGKITKADGKGIELMVIELCEPGENISVVSDRFRKYCEAVITQEFTKLQNEKRTIYRHYIKCNHPDHKGKGSRELSYLDEIENEEHIPCPDFIAKHSIDMKHTWSEWFQQEGIAHRHKDEIPDRMLTEKDLKTIAQELGNNWELLGVELGLSSENIQQINQNHRCSGIETVIFYMLKEWKHRFPIKAYQNVLMEAMRKTHALSVNWDKVRQVFDNN